MNSSYSDVEAELKLLCATSEIRAIPDEPGKAAYVLQNYCGDLEISQTSLSHFFDISRAELKGRLVSIFMGYTSHGYSKPKYLAPIHEQRLAEYICHQQEIHKSELLADVDDLV